MDNYSDLETLVNFDMYAKGFDHTIVEDIEKYWEVMLSDD